MINITVYGRLIVFCIVISGFCMVSRSYAYQPGPSISDNRYTEQVAQPVEYAGQQHDPGILREGTDIGFDADLSASIIDRMETGNVFTDSRLAHPVSPSETELALNLDFTGNAGGQPEKQEDAEKAGEESDIADPLEPLNRVFFVFNDKLYFWVLKPAANAYSFAIPEWGRMRVRNVFHHIKAPIRLVNALLQLKMHKFGAEFAGFVLNSTVGIGGLFDIASRHPELNASAEDLGQTFGAYGIGEGFYIVLPVLGPSSLRDTVGLAGDRFLYPVSYISPVQDEIAVRSVDQVNETSFRIGDYEDIKESALDPYISIRDIYKQHRRNKIRD